MCTFRSQPHILRAEDLSEEEWKAVFAEVFGPDAVADWHT